ncbi:MAG: hypothetical protein KGI08_10210, partial [Thaumarchaeota archaeon]|nr:hypothetical protein [Nitrososphaerota archaeon]
EGQFYVEGVNHQWQMMGPIVSTVSLTRGRLDWNTIAGNIDMVVTNKIFRSGIPLEEFNK